MPSAYPKELNTLGDWIRKTRLDRELTQEQVGIILGVTENCITNWELHRTKPETRYIPQIIAFIGYCPYIPTTDLCQRLKSVRRAFGLTQEQLAKVMQVDECSIASWERGEHQPVRQSCEVILRFLTNPDR